MGAGRHGAHAVPMLHGCLCRTGCTGCSETRRCPSDLSGMHVVSHSMCGPPRVPHHPQLLTHVTPTNIPGL